jgi:putative hemolysin
MHENLFYFSDKRARHLMPHRTDVEWIDITDDFPTLVRKIKASHHGRIICCEDGLDNIIGYLSVRDFLIALDGEELIDVKSMIVMPPVVTENAEAQKVFDLLKSEHQYLCVVMDEYGGFEGIITLSDIVENILGEIPDEGDDYEPEIFVREDKSVLVSGEAPIERLADIIEGFEVDFEEMDYSTVAGYIFNQMNKIPEIGDRFVVLGHAIEVVDIDEHRIDKVLVTKLPEGDATEE